MQQRIDSVDILCLRCAHVVITCNEVFLNYRYIIDNVKAACKVTKFRKEQLPQFGDPCTPRLSPLMELGIGFSGPSPWLSPRRPAVFPPLHGQGEGTQASAPGVFWGTEEPEPVPIELRDCLGSP